MTGHARYTALLDACVLYPVAMADALMSLAAAGLFAAKWTTRIETEWIGALERARPDLAGRLGMRRDDMRAVAVDWEVTEPAWMGLAPGIRLPDPNDAHVLAAAIAGHADCIVTVNLRDFPAAVVGRFGIAVVHPDDFIVQQIDLDTIAALKAFKAMRARWRRPQASVEDFARALERNRLVGTAQRLRDAADLI